MRLIADHLRQRGCLSFHLIYVEGEDYAPFNQTVTLQPGEPLERQFTAMIVNDNRFEQLNEPFGIHMDVVPGPLSDMVNLIEDEANVIIEDDDGWFVEYLCD